MPYVIVSPSNKMSSATMPTDASKKGTEVQKHVPVVKMSSRQSAKVK